MGRWGPRKERRTEGRKKNSTIAGGPLTFGGGGGAGGCRGGPVSVSLGCGLWGGVFTRIRPHICRGAPRPPPSHTAHNATCPPSAGPPDGPQALNTCADAPKETPPPPARLKNAAP